MKVRLRNLHQKCFQIEKKTFEIVVCRQQETLMVHLTPQQIHIF